MRCKECGRGCRAEYLHDGICGYCRFGDVEIARPGAVVIYVRVSDGTISSQTTTTVHKAIPAKLGREIIAMVNRAKFAEKPRPKK